VKDQTGKAGKKMGLLGRIVFLQKLKDELIEKAKHPSTTYFQMGNLQANAPNQYRNPKYQTDSK
jgi:hypothetical protein